MNESNKELLRLRKWAHGLFVLLVLLLLAKVLWESVNFIFYVKNALENDPSSMQLGPMDIPMAAVVYCLALVFQYGVILQTQADETL